MGKSPARATNQPLRIGGERDERTLERVPFLTRVDLRTAVRATGPGSKN